MKQRKDSFFGMHFDFHANKNSGVIGKGFDEEVMDSLLNKVRPDFVQCDTKGHPGLSSYPTKVGNPAPELDGDPMRKWRDLTKKYDVALYSHYSGCYDEEVIKQHPDWAIVCKDDSKHPYFVSLNSDYDKEVLIPQFIELARDYQLDGLWVDGECWGTGYDQNEKTKVAYKKATGKNFEDSSIDEQLEFLRECFRNHVRGYVKATKEVNPNFSVCSNWMYSSQVPEEPTTGVDYISCDLYPTNSIEGSRLETRICQCHDLPWDIMSWGFSFPVHHQKSVAQLCQEAAFIISFGGGFQVYEEEAPSCSMKDPFAIDKVAEIAKFCREREQYVHHNKPICDTAVIYSTKNYYHINNKMNRLFGDMGYYNADTKGIIDVLSENQIASEVVLTYKALKTDLSKYNLLVLGDLIVIEDELKAKLLDYVSNGGNLIITGPGTIDLFKEDLKLTIKEVYPESHFKLITDKYQIELAGNYSILDKVNADNEMYHGEATVDLRTCTTNPPPTIYFINKVPSLVNIKYGKGLIKVVPFNLGTVYYNQKSFQVRDFVAESIKDIDRKIEVKGSHLVDVNINTNHGYEYIHLMNYSGPHEAPFVKTYDEIPSVYNLQVIYKVDREVKSITQVPEKRKVPFEVVGDKIHFKVDKLDIYSIFQIEYK